jgi:hypothetical protein
MTHTLRLRRVRHDGVVRTVRSDCDITDVEDSSHYAKKVELFGGGEAYDVEGGLPFVYLDKRGWEEDITDH